MATIIIWSDKQAQGTIVEEGVADWSGDFTFTIPRNSGAKLTLDIQGLGLLMHVVITIDRNAVYDHWFSPNQQGATIQVPVTLTEGTHNGSVYIHAGLPWGGENFILWTETLNMKIDYTPLVTPGMGTLECHAYIDTTEVKAFVEVVGVGTYTTPFTVNLTAGTYTLNATYDTQTQTKTVTITEGATTRVDFTFTKVPAPLTGPLGIWTFPLTTWIGTIFPNVKATAEKIITNIKERWKKPSYI